MESRKYRTHSKEFNLEALQLLENSEKSASELERELGVTTGLLLKWRQRYKVGPERQSLEPSDLAAVQGKVREAGREHMLMLVYEDVNLAEEKLKDIPGEVLYFKNKPVLKDVIAAVKRVAQ